MLPPALLVSIKKFSPIFGEPQWLNGPVSSLVKVSVMVSSAYAPFTFTMHLPLGKGDGHTSQLPRIIWECPEMNAVTTITKFTKFCKELTKIVKFCKNRYRNINEVEGGPLRLQYTFRSTIFPEIGFLHPRNSPRVSFHLKKKSFEKE